MEKLYRILMSCIIVMFSLTLMYGYFATDRIKVQSSDQTVKPELSSVDDTFSPPAEIILLGKEVDSLVQDLVRMTARLRFLKVRLDSMSYYIRDSLMSQVSYDLVSYSDSILDTVLVRDSTQTGDSCK